jgi:hypothetical protein
VQVNFSKEGGMLPKLNRRRWPRHEKQYLARITRSLSSGTIPVTVFNFSKGGLCFLHDEALEKGMGLTVHLPMELVSLATDVRAEVKWCVPSSTGGYAIGVQYEEPLRWARYE